ncbi:MAG: T9SS type A sorting domain-containing protein, partial [Saprospiraceae bacterium]
VGVDSDYNDNYGSPNGWGSVPCSTPGQKFLISPVIFSGDWNVRGLTLTWIQSLRQYQSTFFISYRYRDLSNDWSNWTDRKVNQEFAINSDLFENNFQHFFLPDANGHDSIQIRFIYNDNYYFWAIDDVKIVDTECSNTRIQTDNFAIAPFAQMPSDQINPFIGFAEIFNGGACRQTGGMLNYTIQDTATKEIVYSQNIHYAPIGSDSFALNQIIPTLVNLPDRPADYLATYTFTQDSADFNPLDNVIRYYFSVGGNTFALEDGFTRVITVNQNTGAPNAYTYGNYFRPAKDVKVDHITWGVYNSSDMAGKTVNVNLIQWSDNNHDQIAQSSERKIIGTKEYNFSGDEEDIINTELENPIEPGSQVIMKGGTGYMAMIEYQPTLASEPQLYLWASDARDYTSQQVATDSAISLGLNIPPVYFSVLGFSADGNISNIDYEVRELNPNDIRIYLGNNIVPLVRIVTSNPDTTNTKSELPFENLITVYPNPSSDAIFVNMDFKKTYQHVQLKLVNNVGQTVFSKTLSGAITNHLEPINVSHLSAGNYMLQVETPDGQRSLPVIVMR